ncbi:cbb3-type cytochrome c oxidase subunit I [Flagellimonas okinawensis]|uniref:Uncharacterized protein n=1 Tax=Flagellimonas okinawensis TaxID=3031324 RepID=A0ABT5XRF4_9FLAO|nr:cbb3-type cytochrome c oxidase subunit I [[Muricauda] okinawensis]MDF0708480.1 hypothetical protein [[Muricauda] okinawensis]
MLFGILSEDAVLDINVHDTYYVITYLHLAILLSVFFLMIGVVYWVMHKENGPLSRWLTWIHIALTFGGPIVIWVLSQFYRTGIMEHGFNSNLTIIINLILLLAIIGQILFPLNIIYGITKKKNKTRS